MHNTEVKYRSPSNIAFVKYWGKYGRQLPMNPSISMTLKNCYTECAVEFFDVVEGGARISEFLFEGEPNEKFKLRLEKYLASIEDILPEIKKKTLKVKTSNSFPHSAGIASSASAMSAFALCINDIVIYKTEKERLEVASQLSRLASGSACRSVYANYAVWGEINNNLGSNEYAQEHEKIHTSFKNVHDSICIVSSSEKAVSSSAGHKLMDGHLFQEARKQQALSNINIIMKAMADGDWKKFGEVLEEEALTLHAMMMTSRPSYILLEPSSLAVIDKIKSFRVRTGTNVYFTIDAGPNIHIIYPDNEYDRVQVFLKNEVADLCEDGLIIHDMIGEGACQYE